MCCADDDNDVTSVPVAVWIRDTDGDAAPRRVQQRPDTADQPGDPDLVAKVVTVPWAMLSAGGMPLEVFLEALKTSCDAGGASGFIAGRGHWKEAVTMAGAERQSFLTDTARQCLEQSLAAAEGCARLGTTVMTSTGR
jgi:tagatose-1,6-bisphosphate aldolase